MNALLQLDQQLFFFINQSLRNPAFDFIMPWAREKMVWVPLYVVLAAYFIFRFRWRSLIIMVSAIITILITDQVASSVIKPAVQRLRPCNDPSIASQVHLLANCGGGYSFVSSHAANHFGLALFLIVILRKRFSWVVSVAIIWAALVSFAQVYVGLHYPLDVTGGGLLGALTGWLTGLLCLTLLKKPEKEPT